MRKLLVTMLVAVFLISSAGFVSASFEDVAGTEFEGAVVTLTSLGLLKGYPDGTFQPDGSITRAEFATVAVRALGLESASEYAKGETRFPDVPATHWASGYVNIAVNQGIIEGYPDGTFKPSNAVTGAEALAMLVRMLGYDPVVTGSWPTGYLVKAFELGLSKGVQFGSSVAASRGTVALFVSNALDIPLMKPQMVGAIETYVVTTDTLLDDKLGFTTVTGRITETGNVFDTDLNEDQIMIDTETFKLNTGLSADDLLGRTVKAWKSGDTIFVMSEVAESIVAGTVADFNCCDDEIKIGTKWYDPANNVVRYRNFTRIDSLCPFSLDGADVKLVLDSTGNIAFMEFVDYDGVGVITNVEPQFGRITVRRADNTTWQRRTTQIDFMVVKNGVAATFSDLKAGDVVYHFEQSDNLYLWAIDNQVTGEVEAVNITAANAIVLVVDGQSVECAVGATISAGLSGFEAMTEANIADFIGADVTLYLDRTGKARHIVGEAEVTDPKPTTWAMVHTSPWTWTGPEGPETFVRLRLTDGSLVRFTLADDVELDLLTGANTGSASTDADYLSIGDIIQITLNKDGQIGTATEPAFSAVGENLATYNFDTDNGLLVKGGAVYKLMPSTLIFDVENIKIVSVDDFRKSAFADPTDADLLADGSFLTAIRIDGDALEVAQPGVVDNVGIVLSRRVTAEGSMVKLLVNDTIHEYLVDETTIEALTGANSGSFSSSLADLKPGDLVEFEAAGGKFMSIIELEAFMLGCDTCTYIITSFDADMGALVITEDPADPDADEATLFVTTDTVIYDCTGIPVMVDDGALFSGSEIQVFTDGSIVKFIKLVD